MTCRRCGATLRDFYHSGPVREDCPSAAVLRQEAYYVQCQKAREWEDYCVDMDREDLLYDMDELRDDFLRDIDHDEELPE